MTLLLSSIHGILAFHVVSVIHLLILLCFPVIPSTTAQSPPLSSSVVISTKLGRVRGRVVQVTSNESCQADGDLPVTTQFLGVPYALPPIGKLRFQEPRKNNGWILQGVLDATIPRLRCPVKAKRDRLPTETHDEGQVDWNREDCLHMNIYVPGNLSSIGYIDAMELPVLVMFNEEEQAGIASEHEDALSRLAGYGQIVIIDLSYRSGVLSYMSVSGEGKFTFGNNGFQDQRLAMLWIWDNVREFGGNPEEITIFAEHQASVSLGYHILRPDSRGLFARAVMHSGTPLSKEYVEHNYYSAIALEVANAVGCRNSEDAECLQSVDLDALLKSAKTVESNDTSCRGHTVDLNLAPAHVLESLEDGFFSQVDLLIGSNEDDGLCHLRETNEPLIRNKISKASMETFIKNTMRARYGNASRSEQTLRTIVDAVLFEYCSSLCSIEQNLTETVAQLLTDMVYRAPVERTARLASRHESDVYLYVISSKNYGCSSLISLLEFMECVPKPVSPLVKNVVDALVSFVRRGNPNPMDGLNSWKPFTERERYFLHFTDEDMQLKQSIRDRKMAFWNDYFPYLLDSDLESCRSEGVVPNSSMDDETNGETVKIPLVLCFLVAVIVSMVLLSLLLFILIRRLHRSHQLSCRHHHGCCFRCCQPGQRQNRHDLIVSAAVPDNEDHILHPLPYADESAWN